ncbi:hypothetical protein ACFLTB_03065 [Chloroflexota bacterium]
MKRARVTEENAYGTALDRLTGSEKPPQAPPERKKIEQPESAMIKLSVFLNRQEDAYLENLASIAKFSGGKKISKTKLVENMVRAFSTTELDVRGVKTNEELLRRLDAQLRK